MTSSQNQRLNQRLRQRQPSGKERAAVLIADMVAFSRRMEQDQAGSVGHVTRSIQLFRALIGDYGGLIANLSGDGILALFDSADKRCNSLFRSKRNFAINRFGAMASRSSSASGSMSAK